MSHCVHIHNVWPSCSEALRLPCRGYIWPGYLDAAAGRAIWHLTHPQFSFLTMDSEPIWTHWWLLGWAGVGPEW